MARKPRKPPRPPSNAYLLSFGDTMTTLLAFFIVLNSLAEEQTGANLYEGTGSFVRALESFGLPGTVPGKRKKNAITMKAGSPSYIVPDPLDQESDRNILGPDDSDDRLRIIDRERDEFERFVNDLAKLSELTESPAVRGEAVFDYFDPLSSSGPLLDQAYRRAMGQILPLLFDARFRVEVVVWGTTPAPTAMERAGRQAHQIGLELIELGSLADEQKSRLTVTAKTWIDAEAKRPTISVITRKLDRN